MSSPVFSVRRVTDAVEWDATVLALGGHPLQLWCWGELKSRFGWQAKRVLIVDQSGNSVAAAQVLVRRLPFPFRSLAYVPRGPALAPVEVADALDVVSPDVAVETQDWSGPLETLADWVKREVGPVSLKIEPDTSRWRPPEGFVVADRILLAHTAIIDLDRPESEIMASFHKKNRQYIRKSETDGVTVERSTSIDDLADVMKIYRQTADRADFSIHSEAYYRAYYELAGDHSQLYFARFAGERVAFLWLAVSQQTAFELYGGMTPVGERQRANYFLKWTAIRACREAGIIRYDMNGLLGEGITRFKLGFVTEETNLVGSFDRPLSLFYPLWAKGLPLARRARRRLGRRST